MGRTALCIGVDNYPGIGADLRGCVNDAEDWAVELRLRGFQTLLLLDVDAQKAAMISAIREMVTAAGPDDLLCITFSGHGTWTLDDSDGRVEAIAPHDVRWAGPLTLPELGELFATKKEGARILFVSDAAHGGRILNRLALPASPRAPRIRFLPPEHFMEPALFSRAELARFPRDGRPRSDALLLLSCRDGEYAFEAEYDDRVNGAFTHSALKALRSLPTAATYQEWLRAIEEYLPSASHPQHAELDGTPELKSWRALS